MVLPPKHKIYQSAGYRREEETLACIQKYGGKDLLDSKRLVFYAQTDTSCSISISYTDNSYGHQGVTAYYLLNSNQFSFVAERPSLAGWSNYFVSSGLGER